MPNKKNNKKNPSKSLLDIVDIIQDIVPEANIVDEDDTLDINAWTSTGNYILNGQMTGSIFKGLPEGRTLMWAGDPGCLHPNQKVKVYIGKIKDHKDLIDLP